MVSVESQRIGRSRGFTLVELLVVIGILVLLLALLLPTFSGVRRQARVTHCASNLHQICAALQTYALDNKGQFPDLTTPGTGGNLWDVSQFFCTAMRKLNVSFLTFLCPDSQTDPSVAQADFSYYSDFNIIQYNIWIPRKNGADIIPPAPNYAGTRFVIASPRPTSPFAGPATAFDSANAMNPVITDIAGSSSAVTPPSTADASAASDPYQFASNSNHLDGRHVFGINCGFSDGHVEFHHGNEVHPYYLGNWWNWR